MVLDVLAGIDDAAYLAMLLPSHLNDTEAQELLKVKAHASVPIC